MELRRVQILIESFRKEIIGPPKWIEASQTFEYEQKAVETVAILKLVRSAQGLLALNALSGQGLVIDVGATIRGIYDAVDEIYFLLETFPNPGSKHVEQFVKGFFEGTVDGFLGAATHQVQRDKIRSAHVRILADRHDDETQKLLERIYKTFSGYTHAGYGHIMEIYNGKEDSFNLSGVSSDRVRAVWAEHSTLAHNAVIMAAAFAAKKFDKREYFVAMMKEFIE